METVAVFSKINTVETVNKTNISISRQKDSGFTRSLLVYFKEAYMFINFLAQVSEVKTILFL